MFTNKQNIFKMSPMSQLAEMNGASSVCQEQIGEGEGGGGGQQTGLSEWQTLFLGGPFTPAFIPSFRYRSSPSTILVLELISLHNFTGTALNYTISLWCRLYSSVGSTRLNQEKVSLLIFYEKIMITCHPIGCCPCAAMEIYRSICCL